MTAIDTVAIVGAGLVGQGWAIVFARAGKTVRLFDARDDAEAQIRPQIVAALAEMQAAGLCDAPDDWLARMSFAKTLEEAVGVADYVQESTFERIDVKREISAAISAVLLLAAGVALVFAAISVPYQDSWYGRWSRSKGIEAVVELNRTSLAFFRWELSNVYGPDNEDILLTKNQNNIFKKNLEKVDLGLNFFYIFFLYIILI
uniref:3-hydroxyacyl-CoA dehydrogenase NAD-binding domain-containing protein n=1 Tax=uncultured Salipiger sp. TaxID=499810 RepID=UPI002597EAFE